MKICFKCGIEKDNHCFNHPKWCKDCRAQASRESYARHRERHNENSKNLKIKTKILKFEVPENYPKDNCEVCNKTKDENKKNLAFDHNHDTGLFRGVLCDSCNRALGYVYDNPDILEKLAIYLRTR